MRKRGSQRQRQIHVLRAWFARGGVWGRHDAYAKLVTTGTLPPGKTEKKALAYVSVMLTVMKRQGSIRSLGRDRWIQC
jgi:hypothetical protein